MGSGSRAWNEEFESFGSICCCCLPCLLHTLFDSRLSAINQCQCEIYKPKLCMELYNIDRAAHATAIYVAELKE